MTAITRRSLLPLLIAAPAIVRYGSLMKIKPLYASGGILPPIAIPYSIYWVTPRDYWVNNFRQLSKGAL